MQNESLSAVSHLVLQNISLDFYVYAVLMLEIIDSKLPFIM